MCHQSCQRRSGAGRAYVATPATARVACNLSDSPDFGETINLRPPTRSISYGACVETYSTGERARGAPEIKVETVQFAITTTTTSSGGVTGPGAQLPPPSRRLAADGPRRWLASLMRKAVPTVSTRLQRGVAAEKGETKKKGDNITRSTYSRRDTLCLQREYLTATSIAFERRRLAASR